MASLPIYQTNNKDLSLLQTTWSSALNPLLSNSANQTLVLPNVALTVGSNVINHRLGKNLTGWSIIRQRGPASIWDLQDTNSMPTLTLILETDTAVTVDIEVW